MQGEYEKNPTSSKLAQSKTKAENHIYRGLGYSTQSLPVIGATTMHYPAVIDRLQ